MRRATGDNAHVNRLLAVIAAAALVLAILWSGNVFARRSRQQIVHHEWPLGLGPLEDVPKRYPPHETSEGAARLTELAEAAGIDLVPGGRPGPAAFDAIRPTVTKYNNTQLERVEEGVDAAPPEIATYFAEREKAIDAIRTCLLSNTSIVWWTDIDAAEQAPLPNLSGHLALNRLFVAHALDLAARGDPAAWSDLQASWRLQRDLWHRPELISKLVALSGTRLINAAARKLPLPVPRWTREMREIDYRRSMLAAQQTESWIAVRELESSARDNNAPPGSLRSIGDTILAPYELACAGNLSAVVREAAGELARSKNCGIDGMAFDRRVHHMLPFWNRPGRMAMPNIGSVWQRVARFRAELEATDRVLELRHRRAESTNHQWPASAPDLEQSDCADGAWTYTRAANGTATLQFKPRIPVPRPQVAIPLEFVGLESPRASARGLEERAARHPPLQAPR
jgi:hypothetical protein